MTIAYAVASIARLAMVFEPAAAAHGLDARVVATIIWVESRGQAGVVSECGAVGLMGVMPYVYNPSYLLDAKNNVDIGSQRLAYAIGRAGSLRRGLLAYHLGIEGAERLGWGRSLDGQAYLAAFADGWAELFGSGVSLPWAAPAREPEE